MPGLSDSSVAYRARTGRLHRVHRGVYAVGHRAASDKRVLHAAVLAVGADAAGSHWSAAVTWGLVRDDPPSDRTRIEVVTTRRVVSRERIRALEVGHQRPRRQKSERG